MQSNPSTVSPLLTTEAPVICGQCQQRRAYGARVWCRKCIIDWQERTPNASSRAGYIEMSEADLEAIIPPRYLGARLETLPGGLVKLFRGLPRGAGVFLWGPPGTGKTHAMAAFAREMWYDGYEVARITYERLMLDIRDAFKPKSGISEMDVIEPYLTVDQLIVEDVGTSVGEGRQESDFSLRTFLVLLDTRLEYCRPTYITSNKPVEALKESFDSRVASRLLEACMIAKLDGRDRRAASIVERQKQSQPVPSGPSEFDPENDQDLKGDLP